jgi:hypothetical protein
VYGGAGDIITSQKYTHGGVKDEKPNAGGGPVSCVNGGTSESLPSNVKGGAEYLNHSTCNTPGGFKNKKPTVEPHEEVQRGETGGGGKNKNFQKLFSRKEDQQYPKIWDRKEDEIVRKVAKSKNLKKWETLKFCRDVIDENSELVKKMSLKERLKENVIWSGDDERKYNEWKLKNVRHLSLKYSKQGERLKKGPFEEFCSRKGIEREKGLWEKEIEKENDLKENILKDLILERKTSRSKSKKLNLYRKCKDTLLGSIRSWKNSPDIEEETLFQELRKVAKKEMILRVIGTRGSEEARKMKETIEDEDEHLKLAPKIAKTQETNIVLCENLSTETLTVKWRRQLCDVKPARPNRAKGLEQLSNLKLTKPQQVYKYCVAEASTSPVTSPAHQWERSSGEGNGQGWPLGQWESRNEQNNVQTAQIGQKRKQWGPAN